eukprot:Opistho-1_new@105591
MEALTKGRGSVMLPPVLVSGPYVTPLPAWDADASACSTDMTVVSVDMHQSSETHRPSQVGIRRRTQKDAYSINKARMVFASRRTEREYRQSRCAVWVRAARAQLYVALAFIAIVEGFVLNGTFGDTEDQRQRYKSHAWIQGITGCVMLCLLAFTYWRKYARWIARRPSRRLVVFYTMAAGFLFMIIAPRAFAEDASASCASMLLIMSTCICMQLYFSTAVVVVATLVALFVQYVLYGELVQSIEAFLPILLTSVYPMMALYQSDRQLRHRWRSQKSVDARQKTLARENEQMEALLLQQLPAPVIGKLKYDHGRHAMTQRIQSVTVCFVDLEGWGDLTAALDPAVAVFALNDLFTQFDDVVESLKIEKIKTIGPVYMVAGNVPSVLDDHTSLVAQFGLILLRRFADVRCAAMADAKRRSIDHGSCTGQEESATRAALAIVFDALHLKIGMHVGEVVAGIVGDLKFCYDIYGDTVNTASRMCKFGDVDTIQCTAAVRDALAVSPTAFQFAVRSAGVKSFKGKGEMETFRIIESVSGSPESAVCAEPKPSPARTSYDVPCPYDAVPCANGQCRVLKPSTRSSPARPVGAGAVHALANGFASYEMSLHGIAVQCTTMNGTASNGGAHEAASNGNAAHEVPVNGIPAPQEVPYEAPRRKKESVTTNAALQLVRTQVMAQGDLAALRASITSSMGASTSAKGSKSAPTSLKRKPSSAVKALGTVQENAATVATKAKEADVSDSRRGSVSGGDDAAFLGDRPSMLSGHAMSRGDLDALTDELTKSDGGEKSDRSSVLAIAMGKTSQSVLRSVRMRAMEDKRVEKALQEAERQAEASNGTAGFVMPRASAQEMLGRTASMSPYTLRFNVAELEDEFAYEVARKGLRQSAFYFLVNWVVLCLMGVMDVLGDETPERRRDLLVARYVVGSLLSLVPAAALQWAPENFMTVRAVEVGSLLVATAYSGLMLALGLANRSVYDDVYCSFLVLFIQITAVFLALPVLHFRVSVLVAVGVTAVFVVLRAVGVIGGAMSQYSFGIGGAVIVALCRRMFELEVREAVLLDAMRSEQESALVGQREVSEKLLYNILPRSIARTLAADPAFATARSFPLVTALTMDVVSFTSMSSDMNAVAVVAMLNTLFTKFDSIVVALGVEKICTIGDAYVAASGLPDPRADQARRMLLLGLGMLRVTSKVKARTNDGPKPVGIRVGVHTSSCVGGILGGKIRCKYD